MRKAIAAFICVSLAGWAGASVNDGPLEAGAELVVAAVEIEPVPVSDIPPPAPAPLQDLSYLAAFQDRLADVSQRENMAGMAIAIIDNGELIFVHTSGEEAIGSGREITERTLFRAASVSKGMTGTLMALLEHEGRVDLASDIPRELLPLPRGRQANALEVLAHRTGLRSHALDRQMEQGHALYRLRERMPQQRTVCRPGHCYSYQNVAYTSLEILAAQAAGLDFENAMRAWLFDRVGMEDATIGVDDLITAESWARPHRRRERGEDGLPRAGDPETSYDITPSAAGVNVSLRDMIAYAQAHLGVNQRLPQPVLDRVHVSQGDSPSQTRRLYRLSERVQSTGYGLGWRTYDWNGRELLTHSGYLSGYGAQIYMEPATGFAFIGLWNADGDAPWWLFPTLMDLRTGDGPGDWLDLLDE